jgi:hypothetical protein
MPREIRIVFWNIHRSKRSELLAELAREQCADIVVVCENADSPENTLKALKEIADPQFEFPASVGSKIQLYCRIRAFGIREVLLYAKDRLSLRQMTIHGEEYLLACVHLVSKAQFETVDQANASVEIATRLRQFELKSRNPKLIVIGDFNMNPFEAGMVSASAWHATRTREIALTGSRIVQELEYPFTYNPMWSHFCGRHSDVPGTYYYRHDGYISHEWNIFDQVLLRPDVLKNFDEEVSIITKIGDNDLKGSQGRPDPKIGSDHFPICLKLQGKD